MLTYVGVALALTAASVLLNRTIAPQAGLVRSFYPQPSFTGPPSAKAVTPDLTLDFVERTPGLPKRHFSVLWAGFWFLREADTVDVYAGADDSAEVFIDRHLVLRRGPGVGTSTDSVTLPLRAGAHEILVRYQQLGGAYSLHLLVARGGDAPAPFPAGDLFPSRPDSGDERVAEALGWVHQLAIAAWVLLPGLALVALVVSREIRARRRPTLRSLASPLSAVALPALVAPVLVFIVGPHTIYAANPGEFNVAFRDIAWPRLIEAAAASWALLLVLGGLTGLFSEAVRRAYVAFLLALGLLVWIQGTFLVPDVGPLYGEGLKLNPFAWRVPYEAAVWIAGVALAIAFARPVAAVAPLASGVFIGLQVAALAASAFGSAAPDLSEATWSGPPAPIYQLSRGNNIVHVVLDGFLSEIFRESVQEGRAAADRDFAGFVFFADHLGAFPTTRASMPAMLTGVTYRNRQPFEQFLDRTTRTQSIASALADHGYAVHSVTFDSRDQPPLPGEAHETVVRYKIPTPYGSYADYVRYAALQLVDFSLFRDVPQGLKPRVYDKGAWLAQHYFTKGGLGSERTREVRASNHAAFLEEFTSRLTVGTSEPVYTFIHVAIPHPPIALDATCAFIDEVPVVRSTYTGQAKCGLLLVRRLLDRLRALGVYDSSIVVLTSDHGWPVFRADHPFEGIASEAGDMEGVVLSAMPLLAVKPAGASGPLQISYAHSAITDVPATILSLANVPNPFPGTPALQIKATDPRPRTFAYHTWVNADWGRRYFDSLYLFSVRGRVLDPASWTFERRILPQDDTDANGPS